MQLLHKVWALGSTHREMVHLWILYCRSILEQSCVVWNGGLTKENIDDLERTQKSFAKFLLPDKTYEHSLIYLNLEKLSERRKLLTTKYAKRNIGNGTMLDLFPIKTKQHNMELRNIKQYKVLKCNTERLRRSSIVKMQVQLNEECKQNKRKRKPG